MAAKAARSCLAFLERVEGATGRQRFSEAYVAQVEADHDRVIELLKPMHEEPLPEWLWLGVRWALMAAYLRSERPREALSIGEQALQTCPSDRMLIFNTAAAFASLGDGDGFDRMCQRLSTSRAQCEDPGWWQSFVSDEANVMAVELGRSRESILRSLAFSDASREVNP
jgi:hypothetical protein